MGQWVPVPRKLSGIRAAKALLASLTLKAKGRRGDRVAPRFKPGFLTFTHDAHPVHTCIGAGSCSSCFTVENKVRLRGRCS